MAKAKTKRTPRRQALPEPDYSLAEFNDPARLREWMNVLAINQSDLAREAGVAQQLVSAIVSGKKPFSEPSRTKIWRAIFRLNTAGRSDLRNLKALQAILALPDWDLYKTPMELKDEEIALLKEQIDVLTRERDLAIEQRDTLQQLVDMNLVDLSIELEKKLADAHQQIADFHRLFALRGAAVAGDELQQKIEERARKADE